GCGVCAHAMDPDTRAGQQLAGGAIGVAAAGEEAPGALEAILPARKAAAAAAYVLEKEELPALDQDPPDLGHRAVRVIDGAEDERGDHRVEAAVVEGQVLGRSLDDGRVAGGRAVLCEPPARPVSPVGSGLGEVEVRHRVW